MKYQNTIAIDLDALQKLFSLSELQGFTTVPVYSIFRNCCVILYEIDKTLQSDKVSTTIPHFTNIRNVRHMVKSSQGKNNREIYQDILSSHIEKFGDDIDNIGFYFDNGILAGSTLFVTYLFYATTLSKTLYDSDSILNFSKEVGYLISSYKKLITSPISLDFLTSSNTFKLDYERKDVWHNRIFSNEFPHDVFIMRLLNIQNELSTCIWLKETLNLTSSYFTLDKYIFIRFSSIVIHESTKNLADMDKYIDNYTKKIGVSSLLDNYFTTISDECCLLRNMLHYSNNSTNFYEYVQEKMSENTTYIDDLIRDMYKYIPYLRISISEYLDIKSIRSMSDYELICRRITTSFIKRKSNSQSQ